GARSVDVDRANVDEPVRGIDALHLDGDRVDPRDQFSAGRRAERESVQANVGAERLCEPRIRRARSPHVEIDVERSLDRPVLDVAAQAFGERWNDLDQSLRADAARGELEIEARLLSEWARVSVDAPSPDQ